MARSTGDPSNSSITLKFFSLLLNPLVSKVFLFYDVGQAYDDNENIDLSALRKSWGGGIRWLSPLGPLRFELGFPISPQPGEDKMQPMFSFGAPM